MKIAFPAGILQSRATTPGPEPSANQTGPFCCSPQRLPSGSASGFRSAGMLNAHCHHAAAHSPYVRPCEWESGGTIFGFGSAAAEGRAAVLAAVFTRAALIPEP